MSVTPAQSASSPAIRVAYLGPEGTFSYFAGWEYGQTDCPHPPELVPCPDFPAVFQAVMDGTCTLGLVPLENSLRGTVGQSFDLFLQHAVYIQAELFARISHCLLSHDAPLADLHTVYSHPQPLAQCGTWLRKNLPGAALVAMESTAAAARRAAREPHSAVVGHWKLSELMHLNILARAIEDEDDNWTRFVVIGQHPSALATRSADDTSERSSLLFTLPDKPGALAAVLNILAQGNINMRKLESRPLLGACWKYAFFVDVECNMAAPAHAEALQALQQCCTSLRLLGCYPVGPRLSTHLDGAAC